MGEYISTIELAEKWKFTDDIELFEEVIDKYRLPFIVEYSGNVIPSDKPDAEEFFISGRVRILEWEHSEGILHIKSVAATPKTKSKMGDRIQQYDGSSLWLYPTREFVVIGTDALLLKKNDVEEFEKTNGLASSPSDREEAQMTTRERENLLRLVAILSKMYINNQNDKRLGTLNKPNISQLTDDIHQFISENQLSDSGLAKRTLHDRFKDAFDLV